MALSKDDRDEIRDLFSGQSAKIIASIDMLSYKLDEFKSEAKDDLKVLKDKVYILELNKTEYHVNCTVKKRVEELETNIKPLEEFVSNHKHMKKFLYAAILFGVPFIIFLMEYFLK